MAAPDEAQRPTTTNRARPAKTASLFVEGFRLLIVLAGAVGGLEVGGHVHKVMHGPLVGMLLGALVAYVVAGVVGRVLDRELDLVVRHFWRTPPGEIFAAAITGTAALLVGVAIMLPLVILVRSNVTYPIAAAVALVLAVFGYRLGIAKGRQVIAAAGLARIFAPPTAPPVEYALLLDASAVMDRQLLVLGKSGLLFGGLVVPNFIIDHLQSMSDGPDPVAARRAHRGLESLDALGGIGVVIEIPPDEVPEEADLSGKLLLLARRLGIRIATCNSALVEQAGLRDQPIIDLRTLATEMTPDHSPGEHLVIDLVKEGNQARQAVGYLPEGDMVVVNDAAHLIGTNQQEVVVLSTRQTSQGLLIFAHPAAHPIPGSTPVAERPLYQGKPDRRAIPRD